MNKAVGRKRDAEWRKKQLRIDEAKKALADLWREKDKYTEDEYWELQKPHLKVVGTLSMHEEARKRNANKSTA